MPNAKVREFLADPDVMALDPATQRELASQIDPELGKFDEKTYNLFVENVRKPPSDPFKEQQMRSLNPGRAKESFLEAGMKNIVPKEENIAVPISRQTWENLTPDIIMGLTGEVLDKVIGNPKFAKGPIGAALVGGAKIGGRVLSHYGTQYAQANLPPEITPFQYRAPQPTLMGSTLEGVLDKGTSGLGNTLSAINKAGGVKNALALKLGKMFPKTEDEAEELIEASRFAKVYDAPNPTINALGSSPFVDTLIGLVPAKAKTDILNNYKRAMDRALSKAFGGKFKTVKALRDVSPEKLAKEAQQHVLEARRIAYKLEDTAWDRVEAVTTASPKTVQYEEVVNIPAVTKTNAYGQVSVVTPASTQVVLKDKTINGAVRIPNPVEFAQILQGDVAKLFDDPQAMFPQNGPLQTQIRNVKAIVDQLAEMKPSYMTNLQGQATQEFITSYETTKALRNGLRKLLEVTHADSSQAALHGASKKLQALLSQAEAASIGDPNLGWFPGSKQAYEQAVAVTRDRVARFSGETGGGILAETRQISDPRTLGLDEVQQMNAAMGSVTRAKQLVAANNGDPTDVAAHFLKEHFHRALKADGTLDGEKFFNSLYDNSTSQSILNSDEIFKPGQRRAIRALASYARANKFGATSAGQAGWWTSKIAYGVIALTTGAGTVALGGTSPGNLGLAATMAVGIPFGKHFIENFILNEKGAALLTKQLYGAASKQQAENITSSMLKMLPRGAQVYVNMRGTFHEAEVDKNGKVKLLRPEELK